VNESLARKVHARNDYDKTIQETEAAYMKVVTKKKQVSEL
jgi:Sjoegren syndrome nuclear autoantigen 1